MPDLGWIVPFLLLLVRGRATGGDLVPAGLVRGALVALGVASLVGMPTQNTALTFWTLVVWYDLLVEAPGRQLPDLARNPVISAGVWLPAFAYVGVLYAVSRTELRVSFRAQQSDWPYSSMWWASQSRNRQGHQQVKGISFIKGYQPRRGQTGKVVTLLKRS